MYFIFSPKTTPPLHPDNKKCRYKTHEAGHGNARGRPHILIFGNRDADDFRTCQDIDMSEQTTAANLDEAIETQMKQSESA